MTFEEPSNISKLDDVLIDLANQPYQKHGNVRFPFERGFFASLQAQLRSSLMICTACKDGLRTASRAIDELFDPKLATPDDVERALFGARSAPQGNRCYLPVQGSILIPALMKRFAADFQAQLADPGRASEIFPIPLLIDYDEERGVFVYDERWVNKRPDWSFEEEPVGTPLETVPPAEALAVHLKPDLATALLERARKDDRPLDTVVDEILRERMNLPE